MNNLSLVCTADTHFPIEPHRFPTGDVLILAGDFLYSGSEREWYPRLEALKAVRPKYREVLFVPGNHDLFFQHYAGPCIAELRAADIRALTPTKPTHEIDGVKFGGSPWVTGLPNWAYNATEEAVWAYLEGLGRVDVLISHSPPKAVLDSNGKGSYGTTAIRKYLHKYQPPLIVCGHVQEGYGTKTVDRTLVVNAAHCNYKYNQTNNPIVVTIDSKPATTVSV